MARPELRRPASIPQGGGAVRRHRRDLPARPAHRHGQPLRPDPAAARPRRPHAPRLTWPTARGAGNGPFGLGWSLAVPRISRRTDRRHPALRRHRRRVRALRRRRTRPGTAGRRRPDDLPDGATAPATGRGPKSGFARIVHVTGPGNDYWDRLVARRAAQPLRHPGSRRRPDHRLAGPRGDHPARRRRSSAGCITAHRATASATTSPTATATTAPAARSATCRPCPTPTTATRPTRATRSPSRSLRPAGETGQRPPPVPGRTRSATGGPASSCGPPCAPARSASRHSPATPRGHRAGHDRRPDLPRRDRRRAGRQLRVPAGPGDDHRPRTRRRPPAAAAADLHLPRLGPRPAPVPAAARPAAAGAARRRLRPGRPVRRRAAVGDRTRRHRAVLAQSRQRHHRAGPPAERGSCRRDPRLTRRAAQRRRRRRPPRARGHRRRPHHGVVAGVRRQRAARIRSPAAFHHRRAQRRLHRAAGPPRRPGRRPRRRPARRRQPADGSYRRRAGRVQRGPPAAGCAAAADRPRRPARPSRRLHRRRPDRRCAHLRRGADVLAEPGLRPVRPAGADDRRAAVRGRGRRPGRGLRPGAAPRSAT